MYTGLKHIHSFTAYLTLALLIIAVIYAFYGWLTAKTFTRQSKVITLLGLMGTHTQLAFGLLLYFLSPLGFANLSGAAMKNSVSRLYVLEHPLMMIVAIALVTYGYSKAKRAATDRSKFKFTAIYFSLGLGAILLMIPWNSWLG